MSIRDDHIAGAFGRWLIDNRWRFIGNQSLGAAREAFKAGANFSEPNPSPAPTSEVSLDIETTCPKCHCPYDSHHGDEVVCICPTSPKPSKLPNHPEWSPYFEGPCICEYHRKKREESDPFEATRSMLDRVIGATMASLTPKEREIVNKIAKRERPV
jgi:hypothetical protein